MPVTINREQRDAIRELILERLYAASDLPLVLDAEDWSQAQRLAGPLADQLRLMADLGWQSDDERQRFELTMPADQLGAAVMWLHEFAAGAMRAFSLKSPTRDRASLTATPSPREPFGDILGRLPRPASTEPEPA
jgi:hypothetical protein